MGLVTGYVTFLKGTPLTARRRAIGLLQRHGFYADNDYLAGQLQIEGPPQLYREVFGLELTQVTVDGTAASVSEENSDSLYAPAEGANTSIPRDLERIVAGVHISNPLHKAKPLHTIEYQRYPGGE